MLKTSVGLLANSGLLQGKRRKNRHLAHFPFSATAAKDFA